MNPILFLELMTPMHPSDPSPPLSLANAVPDLGSHHLFLASENAESSSAPLITTTDVYGIPRSLRAVLRDQKLSTIRQFLTNPG